MEVTSDNFWKALPSILSAIDDASFVAIDGEFTGLSAFKGISAFDTIEERYGKVQQSARQFLLVQFGLCTFHYDEASDSYTNRAFNFYVWPRPYARTAPDPRFLCQTSSIDFLSTQNFDFNKLFKSGVSYLNPIEAERLVAELKEKHLSRKTQNSSSTDTTGTPGRSPAGLGVVPPDQREFVDETMQKLQQFVEGGSGGGTDDSGGAGKKLELEGMTAFQRKLVFTAANQRFGEHLFLESAASPKSPRQRTIVVTRVGAGEKEARERQREEAEIGELEEALGFSRVVRHISESKKVVVGHNMLLDLCHIVNQFVAPLPEDYSDFKSLVNKTFPRIIDTKLMSSTHPFREDISNSALNELKKRLESEPFRLPDVRGSRDGEGYDLESEKYHEAGYDAFVTGLCFIGLSNRLGALSQDRDAVHAASGEPRVPPDSPLLTPFLNKLNLMRMADIPYLNLEGVDIEPERGHVFQVTFPKEWKTSDVAAIFSASVGPVQVSWIDDNTAFVALHNRGLAKQVMAELNCSSIYTIVPYDKYKALQRAAASSSATAPRHRVHQRNVLSTGITPTMEKCSTAAFLSPPFSMVTPDASGRKHKKRSISPSPPDERSEMRLAVGAATAVGDELNAYKRSKSVTEDGSTVATKKPVFEEQDNWGE